MKAALTVVLTLAIAAGTAYATTSPVRTASVLCLENEVNYTMVFTVERHLDPNLNFVQALSKNDTPVPECASHPVESSPFTISVDNDTFQISINIIKAGLLVDTSCGQSKNDLVYTWRFLTAQFQESVVIPTDIVYDAVCDFANASQLNVDSGAVTVEGDPAQSLLQENLMSVLQVLDSSNTPISSAALGDPVKLEVTQIQGPSATITALSCFAGADTVFDEGPSEFELIQSDGCVTTPFGAPYVSTPFVGGSPSARSGEFKQFLFSGSDTVFYRCLVRYCFDSDTSCDNLCASSGRRKRQADGTEEPAEVVQASVKVTLRSTRGQNTGDPSSNQNPVTQAATQADGTTESCLDNVAVIAALAVLGALLVITIIVAVLLYFRSVKLSRWAEKERL